MMLKLKDFQHNFKKSLMRNFLALLMMNATLLFSNKFWMKPKINLEKKKKKPRKATAGVKNIKSNFQDEAVNVQNQYPLPSTYAAQPENLINPEELKEEPVEFDLSSMKFLKVYWTKENELADSLRPRRSTSAKRTKHMPENIKKKSGNPKRYDPIGPVQVKSPTREVLISPVPEIVKIPKSSFAYAFHITEKPPIEQYLDELLYVKVLTRTKIFPERLEFHYSSGSRIPWPLERILDQDYNILRSVYVKLDTKTSFSQGIRSEILKKIEDLRRKWKETSDLPLRLSLTNTGSCIFNYPSRLMTFRDDQGIKRFFRLRDHAKNADIDTLREMQKKLDSKVTEEAKFIEDLQREINVKLARQRRNQS